MKPGLVMAKENKENKPQENGSDEFSSQRKDAIQGTDLRALGRGIISSSMEALVGGRRGSS